MFKSRSAKKKIKTSSATRNFIDTNTAKNTSSKTKSDRSVWSRWCLEIKEKRKMVDLPTAELNTLMAHWLFYEDKDQKERGLRAERTKFLSTLISPSPEHHSLQGEKSYDAKVKVAGQTRLDP